MTWATIVSSGTGKVVGFRLTIEGWPDVWVSNSRITYATNKDSRNVYTGLLTEGLGFSEELNLHEARTIVRGFTAKIRSTDLNDRATASFSTFNRPVSFLNAALTDSGTTINASPSLSTNTYYHIGTETVKTSSPATTIARQKWNTHAQGHPGGATGHYGEPISMPIYDKPPTMEGRRANLFVYGEGDTLSGDGTIVFRGIVSRPPTLDSDGLTWNIQVNPITDLLAQHIAAQDLDAKLYGIYHSGRCPVSVRCIYGSTVSDHYTGTGLFDNLDHFIAEVNDLIAQMLTDVVATNVKSCVLALTTDRSQLHLRMRTGASASNFQVTMGSPLIGYVSGLAWNVISTFNPDVLGNQVRWDNLSANTDYARVFAADTTISNAFIESISDQMSCLGNAPTGLYDAADNAADESPWRVYVDKDLSDQVAAGTFVHIAGIQGFAAGAGRTGSLLATPGGEGRFEVGAQGTDGTVYYIDIVPTHVGGSASQGVGFLDGSTEFTALRDYGEGDLTDFRAALTSESVDANWGDTPFITAAGSAPYGDIANWSLDETVSTAPVLWNRKYVFSRSKSVGEILREECKMIAHYLYLDDDFRIAIRRYPQVSGNMTGEATIDTSTVITPDGKRGMWPGWAPQAQGLVNEVELKTGYDAVADEFTGRSFIMKDIYSIAEHKSRGKGQMTISPYSETEGWFMWDEAWSVARAIMSVMAKDYIQVVVEVPLKFFDLKVGDVVTFTCSQVPNGEGGRGMSNQRAIVWGRQWKFDTGFGRLTLYVPTNLEGGYTPSAYITSQVDNGGNNWTLTASAANSINIAWSENGDGKVFEHFAAGDYVEVIKVGDSGETRVSGTVSSVNSDAGTAVVQFGAAWTPGTDTWVLEWPKDTGSTATTRQQGYTYCSDTNSQLVNGGAAWRFV